MWTKMHRQFTNMNCRLWFCAALPGNDALSRFRHLTLKLEQDAVLLLTPETRTRQALHLMLAYSTAVNVHLSGALLRHHLRSALEQHLSVSSRSATMASSEITSTA